MEQKDFGNNYDLKSTWRFFQRWKWLLCGVAVVAFVISLVASLLVTPRYKSTAILFPTSSNRLSKAILADRYSLDFMDYGIERDCEYAIQILSSQSMEDDVCTRFNMMEHYGISPNDHHKQFKLHEMYRSNVSVKRTEFLGVEVSVLDVDPVWAADIANFIASNYDTLSNRIQRDRAQNSYDIMRGVCAEIQQDIYAYEDSLRRHPEHAVSLRELLNRKCKELAELQSRMSETKVDLNHQISYKFWLDQASPADKKAYPKRAIIVLLGTLGALAVCILVLLIMDRVKGSTGAPTPQKKNNGNHRSGSNGAAEDKKGTGKNTSAKENEGTRNTKRQPQNRPAKKEVAPKNNKEEKPRGDAGGATVTVAKETPGRPRVDLAPNPPAPRLPKAPYNEPPTM